MILISILFGHKQSGKKKFITETKNFEKFMTQFNYRIYIYIYNTKIHWNIFNWIFHSLLFVSDWSILYVIIALLSLVLCWVGFIWGLICLCQRIFTGKRRSFRLKKKPQRYSLLQPDPEDDSSVCK